VTVIASDLLRPNGLAINRAETAAYVTTEIGYDRTGTNRLAQVDLTTGEAVTVSDRMGQPTDIALSRDETEGYVVDLGRGELCRMNLEVGSATLIVAGLNLPYPVAVNRAETLAYVVTEPARAGEYPSGDLLSIDLQTGQVSAVAAGAIFGATGITLSADERLAFVAEFGHEVGCDGSLSIINIDPASTDFGKKTVLVEGLCGAHDVKLNEAETLLYYVEVGASRFSVIRINLSGVRGP
jgi:sugar lactone lactonase YvrE